MPPIPFTSTARFAILALALCCVFWGFSFPVNQLGIHTLHSHIPAADRAPIWNEIAAASTYLGWRFLIAGLIFALAFNKPLFRGRKFAWRGGLVVGAFFGCGMLVQMIGLSFTRPSISGFLTALVVVFAPLAQAYLLKRPVSIATWGAVALALGGAWIMTQQTGDGASGSAAIVRTPPIPFFGEGLTILSAVFFTGQLLALDFFGKRDDARQITLVMFGVTAIIGIGAGAYLSGGSFYGSGAWLRAAGEFNVLWTLASVIVFSTLMAIYLMNVFQPRLAPATASVVYCLEPVFALAFSVLFQTERLTLATGLGGASILAAVLLAARQEEPAAASASALKTE